jgi:hypothetical protein
MNNLTNNYLITFGGCAAGFVLGSLDNICKTKSLFLKCNKSDQPRFLYRPFKCFEEHRNKVVNEQFKTTDFASITAFQFKLWNPFIPYENIIPLLIVGIWNMYVTAQQPEATAKNILWHGSSYLFRVIISPVIEHAVLTEIIFLINEFSKKFILSKTGIDVSDHAILQTLSATYKFNCLTALEAEKINSIFYKVTAAVCSFSDLLGAYNTTANYHSVIDVLAGFALAIGTVHLPHSNLLLIQENVFALAVQKLGFHGK